MNRRDDFLAADWPAPTHIQAGTTLRTGGVSEPPFDTLNLGAHTGDEAAVVAKNRSCLIATLGLSSEPAWFNQVHGTTVADLDTGHGGAADAAVTTRSDCIPVVMTADCLPVVFCDTAGTCWGAAHAGWRGLAAGVLEATVAALPAAPDELLAWLGPAIGPARFEVGRDVLEAFRRNDPDSANCFTAASGPDKYWADIYALARRRLRAAGLARIYGGGLCTVDDSARFYSYRRDGATGRMATLVWSSS